MNQKTAIGVIWPVGAGKDTAALHIAERTALPIYQISAEIGLLAAWRATSRSELWDFSEKISREKWDGYVAQSIIERSSEKTLLIVWMRQLGQIEYLRAYTRLVLIGIDARPEIRFARVRARNRPGDPTTLEEFLAVEEREANSAVQRVVECMAFADRIVRNESTLDELYESLDVVTQEFWSRLLFSSKAES